MQRRGLVSVVLAIVVAGCAPTVDGPTGQQRAVDVADGERLAIQVRALPGVVKAEVLLARPVADPLVTQPPRPPALSVVAIVDDQADRDATRRHVAQLAHVLAADVDPQIVIAVGAVRPELTTVGPFTVTQRSRTALRLLIVLALAAIAAVAVLLALRHRARVESAAD